MSLLTSSGDEYVMLATSIGDQAYPPGVYVEDFDFGFTDEGGKVRGQVTLTTELNRARKWPTRQDAARWYLTDIGPDPETRQPRRPMTAMKVRIVGLVQS